MDLRLFIDNFALLFDEPNGMASLRELIVRLAVTGRLIAPVIHRGSSATFAKDSEIEGPSDLPADWSWVPLAKTGQWAIGSGFPKSVQGETNKPILFCKVSDMNLPGNERFIVTTNHSIDEATAKKIRAKVYPAGTVVFPKIGGAISTNKRRILVRPTAIDNNCLGIIPNQDCSTEWLHLSLTSIDLTKYQSGTSVPALSQSVIGEILIALPPLEEQKRIVARFEEVMRLCDELEAHQQAKRESRVRLNTALLAPLNKAASLTPEEFEQSTTRLADNFDKLYDSINTVSKLRATVLQLAVQGKLVAQDSNDEPASELLRKIRQDQSRMLNEGKIKSLISLPSIDLSRAPFELPVGWAWSRFPELGEFNRGRSKHRPRNAPELYVGGQYKFVQTGDVARANGTITTFTGLYNEAGLAQSRMWPAGTMCITIAANIADSGILGFNACFPDSVVGFIPSSIIGGAQYFEYFMRTAKSHLQDYAPSTAQKNINISILQEVMIPLPPLAEQKRIVAKVNQLMSLCDELEAKLRQAEADSEKLMNAAVKHVLDSVRSASQTAEEVFA